MSGECEKCGEHCLECSCKQKRPSSVTPRSRPFLIRQEKFAIIGGDIHLLITKDDLEKTRKNSFVPWFIEENNNAFWIPVRDEKANPQEGRWVWVKYAPEQCELCRRKFFYRTMEG